VHGFHVAGSLIEKPVPLTVFRAVEGAAGCFGAAGFFAWPPPTILNVGLATTSFAGSDHYICCEPLGNE